MTRVLKIIMWVLIILIAIGVLGFFWAQSVWDKISFGVPKLQALNLDGLTLADLKNALVKGESKKVTATLSMEVGNKNNFAIPFSSLRVKLSYQGSIVAETSNMLQASQKVPANGTLTATDDVKITLSKAGIQMLIDKLVYKTIKVQFDTYVKVFGIPLPKPLQTTTIEF